MLIIDQGIFTLELVDNRACMNFDTANSKYPKELVESSFQREVNFLHKISKYYWAPENIQVSESERKLFFKWYGSTCEQVVPPGWGEQLAQIASDLHTAKIYKPNFYPKCFYTDNNDCLHAFVFYSSSDYAEQPISIDFYKPILNEDRLQVVDQLSIDGKLDMKFLIEKAFNEYIKWPGDPLPGIYKRVYG